MAKRARWYSERGHLGTEGVRWGRGGDWSAAGILAGLAFLAYATLLLHRFVLAHGVAGEDVGLLRLG